MKLVSILDTSNPSLGLVDDKTHYIDVVSLVSTQIALKWIDVSEKLLKRQKIQCWQSACKQPAWLIKVNIEACNRPAFRMQTACFFLGLAPPETPATGGEDTDVASVSLMLINKNNQLPLFFQERYEFEAFCTI